MRTHELGLAVLVILVSVACDKKLDATAQAASAAPSAAPAPAASAAATGGICPRGSSGKGTSDAPCTGPGRALVGTWTGKHTKQGSLFSVTNKLKVTIDFEQAFAYYYDASGKQLTVTLKWNPKFPEKMWAGSGGLFTIGPGETKEFELGYSADLMPKATKSIEIEFGRVGFKPADGQEEVYWENNSLVMADRPMGANK